MSTLRLTETALPSPPSSGEVSIYVDSTTHQLNVKNAAGKVTPLNAYVFDFTEGDGTGVIFSLLNPFGVDVIIERLYLDITTPSTGASTIDAGTAAAAGTNGDNLIDDLSGAAAGLFSNLKNPGTNGKSDIRWESDQYLNIGEASGDVVGLIGKGYLRVVPLG